MRRRTFSSPYYVKGRSHQAEHGGAWRQLEATGVSSSWWLSGNPGSGATLSKDCGRAKRVRNVSRLGAQSGCELRFYAYAIGLKEVGLVRADCVSGHESSKRVQCGEPICIGFIPLSAEPAKRAKSFVFRFESLLAHSESARRKTGTFRLALSPVHRRVQIQPEVDSLFVGDASVRIARNPGATRLASDKSRFWYAIPKRLLRNHPNRPQPRLHQLRPCRPRKLRSPQSERVPSLSIQMHLHGNASVLQRNVVSKRVVYVVHVVILVLQQERRWRLGGHWNFGIQRKMFIGRRRMRNHELFGALLSIPFRRGKRQMAWIDGHRKVRSATFFVGDIDSRVQTLRVVRADRCRQMPT